MLAGGVGSRLVEETHAKPKPLLEIGGKPVLWHIMKLYEWHGITDFIICAGYRADMMKEYFAGYMLRNADIRVDTKTGAVHVLKKAPEAWQVSVVDTGLETETGGRLKRIAQYVAKDPYFCMTYGDSLVNVDVSGAIAFHRKHKKLATISIVEPRSRFGNVQVEGDLVRKYEEKSKDPMLRLNAGFFVLSPGVLDYIQNDRTVWEKGPLEKLAAQGNLAAWRHRGYWQPMDTLAEHRQLESMWRQGKAPWKVWRDPG